MGCTSPILGMRISPILTIGTLGRSMTGGAEGRVRGAGSASGGAVVTVVGAIGSSPNDSPTTDAAAATESPGPRSSTRSEEHTSELQSQSNLVCRLLPEKKNTVSH